MTPAAAVEPIALPAPLVSDDLLYEVVNGQRVEKPPKGVYQSVIASNLFYYLCQFPQLRQLGRLVSETLFDLPTVGRQRRPDMAFVSFVRWPRAQRIPRRENAWTVVPDLAIEVISPKNTATEVMEKVHEYFQAGVLQVWVVWPDQDEIYVYEGIHRIRVLGRSDTLEGGAVLAGFELPMATLFDEPAAEEPNNP